MQEKIDKQALVENLAARILTKRDEAVRHRASSGVETRWREDEAAFDGLDTADQPSMLDYATGASSPKGRQRASRSRVVVNIIRGKCDQTEGRFADIQLPVDDRNWGLETTPVPELALQAQDETQVVQNGQPVLNPKTGTPVTLRDLAENELQIAQKKMEGMQDEIDDQLTECSFNGECRKALRDAVRLGTGILKGPSVVKRLRKVWKQTEEGALLEISEAHKPFSKRVDPWNVFPDPECGDDIKRAGYIWERDYILPREVRRLVGVKGYNSAQIKEVLKEEPKRTTTIQTKRGLEVQRMPGGHQTYEMWEYHGDLTVEELDALDCGCGEMKGAVSACVVFINDRPVKAVLNLLDVGDLPYDFFQWTQVTDSVWGIGVPRTIIWQQRILTAAWRMMMDNGKNSTRGHVVKGDGLTMVDNSGPYTMWEITGDMQDVRQAFGVFFFPNNQQDLQNIIDLALRFVDLETSMPMAFHGEQVGPAETLGAVELKIDSSNVALRSRVKLWDDQITRPHLARYYHWNMQYNENDEIKGDYNVNPRGVSVLLSKEQAAQHIAQLMQLRNDPVIGAIVDWVKAVKQMLSAQKVDVLKSDEEIDAALKKLDEMPPQDPRAMVPVQVAEIRADAGLKAAQMKLEADQAKAAATLPAEAQEADKQRQHEKEMALITRETRMLELAAKGRQSLEQIKADLASDTMKLNVQQKLSMEASRAAEVAAAPTEPAGRAKPGEAFER
ncbi:MAG: hypothetical protein ABIK07_14225 [Planctomycetota bacterium]